MVITLHLIATGLCNWDRLRCLRCTGQGWDSRMYLLWGTSSSWSNSWTGASSM